ncbi:MAG: hypothetical protein ACYC22_01575 [Thiomonas delicata]
MSRREMPRVYELQDLIRDRSASSAYFQDFGASVRDEPEKRKTWLARERVFQRLDPEAWQFLKSEANPYLTKRNTRGRGHQQLISILNQAWAYNFLIDEGCLRAAFIPPARREGHETPDLEGELKERGVLCEVKTVSISDNEAARRQNGAAGSTFDTLEVGFFNKLTSDLLKARSQLESYDGSAGIRRIAFIVLDFDDFLGEYKANYFRQIDRHLADNPAGGIEIVFYNQRTPFHFPISMRNATVVNEPG